MKERKAHQKDYTDFFFFGGGRGGVQNMENFVYPGCGFSDYYKRRTLQFLSIYFPMFSCKLYLYNDSVMHRAVVNH